MSTATGCGGRPDSHKKYEVVFGIERTRDAAQKLVVRAKAKHFKTFIEVEGCAAFEVSTARFPNRAAAQVVANNARKAGFTRAKLEES